jgi:ribosomal-protein-alanine N-acetyltransferase
VTTIRPLAAADVPALTDLAVRNRAFLSPTEPHRDESYFTREGHAASVANALAGQAAGTTVPFVILDGDDLVGRISLNNVVRGPLQSAVLGYWVDEQHTGHGIATAAVAALLPIAFEGLGLHRIEAGTLVDNHGSQRVLLKSGFIRFGLAPRLLLIDGEWRDHVLFQKLAD